MDERYIECFVLILLEEIQIDLADFTRSASENDGYRYCLVAVDVFTKMFWGVPINSFKKKKKKKKKRKHMNVLGL